MGKVPKSSSTSDGYKFPLAFFPTKIIVSIPVIIVPFGVNVLYRIRSDYINTLVCHLLCIFWPKCIWTFSQNRLAALFLGNYVFIYHWSFATLQYLDVCVRIFTLSCKAFPVISLYNLAHVYDTIFGTCNKKIYTFYSKSSRVLIGRFEEEQWTSPMSS